MACIGMKPVVDRLEQEMSDRLLVVRLNVQDSAHSTVINEFQVRATPTFILLDPGGVEIWRSIGSIDPEVIDKMVDKP
jgi:thiol-disulfide isomerase/thioredoxin